MKLKHALRDTCIYLISITGVSFLYRLFMLRKGPLVRVIAFHDVHNKKWFEEVIKMLHTNFNVITPEQFHIKKCNSKKINVLLTFDDGYQSWIDTCKPVLDIYNFKGLFFINSGLLDCKGNVEQVGKYMNDRLLISPKVALIWEGAAQLIAGGHTIGGHTVTHPNLGLLKKVEVEREIVADKKKIENQLQVRLTDFAYPFGQKDNWNSVVFDVATEAGYTFTYTAQSGFATGTDKNIPRVCIEKDQSLQSICLWSKGGYDIFQFLTRLK